MEKLISVIIPNYNGSAFIGKCLEAVFASTYGNFEVVVVDDASTDNSVEIINRYPCRLLRLDTRSGAGAARNHGAGNSRGEVLFFTDADCLMRPDALTRANHAVSEHAGAIIGGTYTPLPFDTDFFSAFQSLFIHYSETKKKEPDYIAGHAMVIDADLFRKSGGFREEHIPVPEDVEFSHRLRRTGCRLVMKPGILVTHIFNFTFLKSLRNAYRKSKYWTRYSLANQDVLADSGTASVELKVAVACLFLNILFVGLVLFRRNPCFMGLMPFLYAFNLYSLRGTIKFFFRQKGTAYSILAVLYYTLVYALAVGVGAFMGIVSWILARHEAV
jgi:glycosyltransferase involved in cell wall biosynthesis